MSITKNMPLNWYSSMKKKIRKIRTIFDIENWLWKSEIGIFRTFNLEQTLIYPIFFFWKSAIFHPIKLPFDAEAAEKFLKVIYYWRTKPYIYKVFSGHKLIKMHLCVLWAVDSSKHFNIDLKSLTLLLKLSRSALK